MENCKNMMTKLNREVDHVFYRFRIVRKCVSNSIKINRIYVFSIWIAIIVLLFLKEIIAGAVLGLISDSTLLTNEDEDISVPGRNYTYFIVKDFAQIENNTNIDEIVKEMCKE